MVLDEQIYTSILEESGTAIEKVFSNFGAFLWIWDREEVGDLFYRACQQIIIFWLFAG